MPNFAAGGIATPADAALCMALGAEAVFVGSGIFKSEDPAARARAIVHATTHWQDPAEVLAASRGLGKAMAGLAMETLAEADGSRTAAGGRRARSPHAARHLAKRARRGVRRRPRTIGEAAINWGDWQWWPLWVVDYVCVVWLLAGVYARRAGGRPSAWLTSGLGLHRGRVLPGALRVARADPRRRPRRWPASCPAELHPPSPRCFRGGGGRLRPGGTRPARGRRRCCGRAPAPERRGR